METDTDLEGGVLFDDILLDTYSDLVKGLPREEALDKIRKHNHKTVVKYAKKGFAKAARRYAKNPKNFVRSWRYLCTHPAFIQDGWTSSFADHLWIHVYGPKKTKVALETGAWHLPEMLSEWEREAMPHGIASHDYLLDTYAPTFEKAIIKLAAKVRAHYGDEHPDTEGKWPT